MLYDTAFFVVYEPCAVTVAYCASDTFDFGATGI